MPEEEEQQQHQEAHSHIRRLIGADHYKIALIGLAPIMLLMCLAAHPRANIFMFVPEVLDIEICLLWFAFFQTSWFLLFRRGVCGCAASVRLRPKMKYKYVPYPAPVAGHLALA